jgi:5-methylcytosine-specific restriction endonuclease McrA
MSFYRKKLSKKEQTFVLERQDNKCANNIHKPAIRNYDCPLWKYNHGNFDEAGCEFDHINELCKTGDNNISNYQALCPSCHRVKTRKFLNNKKQFTSTEINNGRCLMDIATESKKRKII